MHAFMVVYLDILSCCDAVCIHMHARLDTHVHCGSTGASSWRQDSRMSEDEGSEYSQDSMNSTTSKASSVQLQDGTDAMVRHAPRLSAHSTVHFCV